jgi:cytoskeletal protein RodZ
MTNHYSTNTAGFAPLEVVLLLVAVTLIGFIGWDVYHVKRTSDALLTPSNSNSPAFKANTTTASATPSTTTSNSSDNDSSLQADLATANSANSQSTQDMTTTNNGLNDQSTFTTVPQ